MKLARIALIAWSLASAASAQQPRDGSRPALAGTATIAGIVVMDDAQARPLRRARVTLNNPDRTIGRTAISNDDGSFVFSSLPAGRYSMAATKDAYVAMNYGARRTGRPGTPLVLADGESRRVTLRIPRGAVITGTIVDVDGQPAAGIQVTAMTHRFITASGERRLVQPTLPTGLAASMTDERGVYRVFGFPPGDYVVVAQPRAAPAGELQTISAAELRRALSEAAQTSGGPIGSSNASSGRPAGEARRNVTLAPIYFPGRTDVTQATTVTLGAGEERAGIDFQLQHVAVATVSGVVTGLSADISALVSFTRSGEGVAFEGTRASRTAPEGRFSFGSVLPGRYVLFARAVTQPPRGGPGATAGETPPTLWASTEVVVDGEDVSGIGLTLQPGLTISGRVAFEGTTPPPPIDLLRLLRVPIPATALSGTMSIPLPAVQFETGGRFSIAGIMPGPYRLGTLQGVRSPIGSWWLKSLTFGGRDLLDATLDLRQGGDDAVVTFSDRASELSGRVTSGPGRPACDCTVIAFSTANEAWFFNSRRVAGVRAEADGRYVIRNLPPGDYLVVASDDVEPGEWYDPPILQRLASRAARITIGEYERKTFDIVFTP